MARPLQYIHAHAWRIGHLEKEDFFTGYIGNAGRIVVQGQRMKTVEYQTQMRMIHLPDDLPCLPVELDMAAPRQRLIANTDIPFGRTFGQFTKLRGA